MLTSARVALLALALIAVGVGGCGLSTGGAALCEAAGGAYAPGTCSPRSTPELVAAQQGCEARGGVFLAGQNVCAFGMGR